MNGLQSIYNWGLFENAPVPISIVDKYGNFLDVNKKWVELTGYSYAELKKMNFKEITDRRDISSDIEMAERLAKSDKNSFYSMYKTYIRKDGTKVLFKLHVNNVLDENNKFLYYVSWAIPIAEKKALSLISRLEYMISAAILLIIVDIIIKFM